MSLEEAKAQLDREPGEPEEEYVDPSDIQQAFDHLQDAWRTDITNMSGSGDGTRWWFGEGPPVMVDGASVGDFYLDVIAYNVHVLQLDQIRQKMIGGL